MRKSLFYASLCATMHLHHNSGLHHRIALFDLDSRQDLHHRNLQNLFFTARHSIGCGQKMTRMLF